MNSWSIRGSLVVLIILSARTSAAQEVCDARLNTEFPCYTPFDVKPVLLSVLDARRSMARHYPKALKEKGVGGTVHLSALLDDQGAVRNAVVTGSSGLPGLDRAAVHAASEMRFSPAKARGSTLWAWIQLPLGFCVTCPENPFQRHLR